MTLGSVPSHARANVGLYQHSELLMDEYRIVLQESILTARRPSMLL